MAFPYPLCSVTWQPRVCSNLGHRSPISRSCIVKAKPIVGHSIFILNNLAPPCHTSLLLQMPTLTRVVATLRSLRTTRLSHLPRSVAGTRSRLHRRGRVDLSLPLSVPCNHLVKKCSIARAVAKFSHPALILQPILLDVAQQRS